MTDTTPKYLVDEKLMDNYIQVLNRRRRKTFIIATVIVLVSQTFITYRLDSDFPFWIFIIVTAIIIVAFYFGLRLTNDKLRQLANSKYFIDNNTIIQQTEESTIRQLKFKEIAVIHEKYSGTILVKGTWLTKIDYIRPKRTSPYQVGSTDTIFIPKITTNYSELMDKIKISIKVKKNN